MKTRIIIALSLVLPVLVHSQIDDAALAFPGASNSIPVPQGWLQSPSRALVLDIRHQFLEPSARRDAGEFVMTVLNLLVNANYNVGLSDDYILDEIKYYRSNLTEETPAGMSKAILECLEKTRDTGLLNWDNFKQISRKGTEMVDAQRHLPWMAVPVKAKAITLAGTNAACPRLQLKLLWSSREARGAVQYDRRPGMLSYPQETVIIRGQGTLWRFGAVLRLENGGQQAFFKVYPACEWQRAYFTASEYPVTKLTQAIVMDLATGLKAKPVPVSTPVGRKSRPAKKAAL